MIEVGLGLLVGLVTGVLGAGGGILTVPMLVYVLGMAPVPATTASLVVVAVASLAALLSHARSGRVRWGTGATFGLLGVVGTWVGSWAAQQVHGDHLLLAFGILLLTVAVLMLRHSVTPAPQEAAGLDGRRALQILGAALLVGLLTGLFGVGGGFVVVPALVLLLRMPMSSAVGTSLVVIIINSLSALVSRLEQGVVLDWRAVQLFTAAAVVGGLAGAGVSKRLPNAVLSRALGILLVLIATWTLVRSGMALSG